MMKITDVLREELMILSPEATTKEAILDEMAKKLYDTGAIDDYDTFRQAIAKREESASTGIGDGVAMPHTKHETVKETSVVFAKHQDGIDFDSMDGKPARSEERRVGKECRSRRDGGR